MEWCHFAPFHFAPQCHFTSTCHVPFCPQDYVWRKAIMWTIISPVAQPKWCENENIRNIIISNHMQRFYYLICQSNWCQTVSKLIYQKGEITFLRYIQNVVYCKFDFDVWHWTARRQKSNGQENRPTTGMLFSKHPVFHFAPMFHFAPTYYMYLYLTLSKIPLWSTMTTGWVGARNLWSKYR